MNGIPDETEYCWLALPPAPEALLARIAALPDLGGFPVEGRAEVQIEDIVLDDGTGTLAQRGLTLRLRLQDGRPLLTVKGAGTVAADGATTRSEFEAPFDGDALAAALHRLEELGGPAAPSTRPSAAGEPLAVLAGLGWQPAQRRANRRRRSVLVGPHGAPLAELALDTVTFTAGDRAVRHAEVELELQGSPAAPVAPAIRALVALGGDRLRPWPHSKTALARVLLASAAELDGWTGPDGFLLADAYAPLERLLRG